MHKVQNGTAHNSWFNSTVSVEVEQSGIFQLQLLNFLSVQSVVTNMTHKAIDYPYHSSRNRTPIFSMEGSLGLNFKHGSHIFGLTNFLTFPLFLSIFLVFYLINLTNTKIYLTNSLQLKNWRKITTLNSLTFPVFWVKLRLFQFVQNSPTGKCFPFFQVFQFMLQMCPGISKSPATFKTILGTKITKAWHICKKLFV